MKYMLKQKFAERLKMLRTKHNVSQGKLAAIIGVDPTFISQLENQKCFVSVEILVLLAKYFNVSTDFLVGLRDN